MRCWAKMLWGLLFARQLVGGCLTAYCRAFAQAQPLWINNQVVKWLMQLSHAPRGLIALAPRSYQYQASQRHQWPVLLKNRILAQAKTACSKP
jgi:hypothetical protein